jgi:hypothetical protein
MKPLLMARLVGTQSEMGAQHGRLVAADATRLFDFYATMPERQIGGGMRGIGGSIGRAAIRSIANAWQARLTRERPAELVARTRAFADAVRAAMPDANIPGDAVRTLATMDSMQNCVSLAARGKLGPFAGTTPVAIAAATPACSSAIAWGDATADGELLFGRNFDFPGVGVWDAAPAFVVCVPSGANTQRYGFFATRGADAPVVTVVNEAGLVLAPHTRWHRGVTFGGAMIVDVVHDIARRAETLADAERIARERPISSSWGIAVGSAREKSAMVIEVAGPAVEIVRPAPGASFLVCANRYRTPALQTGQLAASSAWAMHSERRERRLRALVDNRARPLVAEDIARFLGDRHDVDAPEQRRHMGAILAQGLNVHCAVVAPAHRRALVGVDRAPCCEGTFAELAWTWEGGPGAWELGPEGCDTGGFTARVRTDVAAPHDVATKHVHEAARAYESAHDVTAALASLERAIAADPDDPSLRLPAAWLALEAGMADRAVVHVHAGLARETESYRRGQFLLWGARAARRIDPAQARRWTDELERAAGAGNAIAELAAAVKRPFSGRPRVNLMMADAY